MCGRNMKPLLPSIGSGHGSSGSNQIIGNGSGPTLLVKQLKTINSSPIRNNTLKSNSSPSTVHPRSQSADEALRKSTEDMSASVSTNNDPQSLAILRVMKSIRKQRLIQQRTEEEMKRDQKLRADKILIKNTQRHRLRAEVYAINAYLKSVEQQRYDEMIKAKFRGETNRTEITYDSDSSGSHESEDSDSAGRQNQQGNSEKKSVAGAPKANNPSRSYGV